ncbi:uncharacterized protein MONBRDRAFT_32462, partial [Monosiga brevicollis MX1]
MFVPSRELRRQCTNDVAILMESIDRQLYGENASLSALDSPSVSASDRTSPSAQPTPTMFRKSSSNGTDPDNDPTPRPSYSLQGTHFFGLESSRMAPSNQRFSDREHFQRSIDREGTQAALSAGRASPSLLNAIVQDECRQWRTEFPHLRLQGHQIAPVRESGIVMIVPHALPKTTGANGPRQSTFSPAHGRTTPRGHEPTQHAQNLCVLGKPWTVSGPRVSQEPGRDYAAFDFYSFEIPRPGRRQRSSWDHAVDEALENSRWSPGQPSHRHPGRRYWVPLVPSGDASSNTSSFGATRPPTLAWAEDPDEDPVLEQEGYYEEVFAYDQTDPHPDPDEQDRTLIVGQLFEHIWPALVQRLRPILARVASSTPTPGLQNTLRMSFRDEPWQQSFDSDMAQVMTFESGDSSDDDSSLYASRRSHRSSLHNSSHAHPLAGLRRFAAERRANQMQGSIVPSHRPVPRHSRALSPTNETSDADDDFLLTHVARQPENIPTRRSGNSRRTSAEFARDHRAAALELQSLSMLSLSDNRPLGVRRASQGMDVLTVRQADADTMIPALEPRSSPLPHPGTSTTPRPRRRSRIGQPALSSDQAQVNLMRTGDGQSPSPVGTPGPS